TMFDAGHSSFVTGQPGDCTDRPGSEQETICVACPQRCKAFCQVRQQRQSRAVVIGERWMADMGREKKFIVRLAAVELFSISQMTMFQGRVDEHLIDTV